MSSEGVSFSLVHGRYHSGWCWHLVQEELSNKGFNSVAPDFPIEHMEYDLNDHARILASAENASGSDEIVRVGWSWGANVIPRAVSLRTVKKLIYIAGVFHPASIPRSGGDIVPTAKHTLAYGAVVANPDAGLEVVKETANYTFYHDVDADLRKEAISRLREHPRRAVEPYLPAFPVLPMEYIVPTEDHAVVPETQQEVAKYLGMAPTLLEGSGHCPMLSRPRELAELLIKLSS